MVIWGTLLQRRVPPHMLGRVASLDFFVSVSLMPVSMALAGPVSEAIGLRTTFAIAAIAPIFFAVIAVFWAKLPQDELAHPLRDERRGVRTGRGRAGLAARRVLAQVPDERRRLGGAQAQCPGLGEVGDGRGLGLPGHLVTGDEAPGPAARLDDAGLLELAVRAGDRVGGDAQVLGQPADGRQPVARLQCAAADLLGDLGADLLVRRGAGRAVEVDQDAKVLGLCCVATQSEPQTGSLVLSASASRTAAVVQDSRAPGAAARYDAIRASSQPWASRSPVAIDRR